MNGQSIPDLRLMIYKVKPFMKNGVFSLAIISLACWPLLLCPTSVNENKQISTTVVSSS